VPVTLAQSSGLDASNGALRLVYECARQGGDPLWIEAERASVLRFTPGKGQMEKDAEASSGVYVAHVENAEFHLAVKQAGAYPVWYRGFFPWAGTWLHYENMDGGPTQTGWKSASARRNSSRLAARRAAG